MTKQYVKNKPLKVLIQESFYADFDSGKVYWKVNKKGSGAKVGKEAGTLRDNGYFQIKVGQRVVRRSHVVWCLLTGELPPQEIDHIDRNPSNDCASNLRLSTSSLNKVNQRVRSDNRSGYRGVHRRSDTGRWVAQIALNGKRITLGTFLTLSDAVKAYRSASLTIHGEFSTLCQ